jgi:putative transposase
MLKAIKIRLYPNNNQEIYISKLLGSYRYIYNNCLNKKINTYKENKTTETLTTLGKYFHNELLKNEELIWLKEHNTKVLKQSIINMLDSYNNFFKNNSGFPKFKSKHDNKLSCRFPLEAISKRNDFLTNKITLTGELKNIKFKCSNEHKEYLNKYKINIKSATLSKTKSGDYFLSILIDGDLTKKLKDANNIIAIDLGIKDFIVDSNGNRYENIKIKRNNKNKLIKLNRNLSKKQKGSKNKEKARIKLAKYNNKLNNIKENYLHRVTNQLLNENQVIVMEDLNVKGMMKNHNLAKSIQELSLYRFKEILKYKAEWYGRDIIEINRFFPSSKLCSTCGTKNDKLTLKDREWTCTSCNTVHDRDVNAAFNILNEGKRTLKNKIPIRDGKLTPLETSGYAVDELGKMFGNSINFHYI